MSARTRDTLFLALVVLLSTGSYVTGLGFYSDDWALVGFFSTSPQQALVALFRDSHPVHFASRPVQAFYSALLYKLFGLQPLGYHVVNAFVLAAGAVLLYLSLTELALSRLAALSIALTYAVLPNYATARFWFAVFAGPLSMLLLFGSLYADLRAAASRDSRWMAWRMAAVAALLLSTMAYEVALPLFFFVPLVAWWYARRTGARWPWSRALAFILPNLLLLAAIGLYKARSSHRLAADGGLLTQIFRRARDAWRPEFTNGDYGLNVWAALEVNFVDHLVKLPVTLRRVPETHAAAVWLGGASVALVVLLYVRAVAAAGPGIRERPSRLIAAGLVLFGGGYSIFLTNQAIQITPYGVGNRTALAASIGVALIVVAVIRAACRNPAAYSVAIACLAGASTASVGTIASFWSDAYSRERDILSRIERDLPALPPRAIVILDGICRYNGPAIVFESSWDLEGALRARYHRRDIMADVVSPSFVVEPTGVATYLYDERYEYAYAPEMQLYDVRTGRAYALTDKAATRQALAEVNFDPVRDCPPAKEGVGAAVAAGK